LAEPTKLGHSLGNDDAHLLGSLPSPALRLFVRYLSRHPQFADETLVEIIWSRSDDILKADALRLASGVSSNLAETYARSEQHNRSASVRAAAFEELIRSVKDKNSIEAAFRDESAVVRRRAVFALSGIPPNQGEHYLRFASRDPSPLVREAVLEVLGHLGLRPLKDLVIDALQDPFDFVRESAVYAAKSVMSQLSAAQLVLPMVSDSAARVREAAFRLADVAGISAPSELTVRSIREGLPSLATAAISAARHSITVDVEDAIIDLIKYATPIKAVLIAMLRIVGTRRPTETAFAVAEVLAHADPEIVAEAVVTLQRLAISEASVWLAPLVMHANTDVRERTVYALAELGGVAAMEGLRNAIWDPDPTISARAIYGLARLADTSARQLISMVSTKSEEVERAQAYYFSIVGKGTKNESARGKRTVR
jgi:HEAT repeat protein